MKKIIKTLCCLLFAVTVCLSFGCNNKADDSQKVNGFENYDEIRLVRMLRASGALSVNTDSKYFSEGNASVKFTLDYPTYLSESAWIRSNFDAEYPVNATSGIKILAKSGYNSLKEISAFKMYVHNANDYGVTLIFTARDVNNKVLFYQMQPLLKQEGKTVEFSVSGTQSNATVSYYELSFYGAKQGVFYLDDFRVVKGTPTQATLTHSGKILAFDNEKDLDKVQGLSNTFLPTVSAKFNQNVNFAKSGYSLRLDKLGIDGKEHLVSNDAVAACKLGNGFTIDGKFLSSLNVPSNSKIKADVYVLGNRAETLNVIAGNGVTEKKIETRLNFGEWQTVELSLDGLENLSKLNFTLSTLDAQEDVSVFIDNIRYE